MIDSLVSKGNDIHVVEEGRESIIADGFTLTFVNSNKVVVPNSDPAYAYIDMRHIKFPLILRKWKSGDYFYPLGMQKKKKVAKFLTDIKLSRIQKENQWVIESNKKILWVVGWRIDDRVKVVEDTKQVMIVKLHFH